jgi:hypothetical protein
VEEKYQLQKPRALKNYDEQARKDTDFFTALDQDFLLRLLLNDAGKNFTEIVKVSGDKYKFSVRNVDENQNVVDMDIEFRSCKDELLNVDFVKREGDSLKFHQKVVAVKQYIQEVAH